MSRRRVLGVGVVGVALAVVLAWTFCPRPSLYGDIPFSLALTDRHGELLRLGLAADDRYRLRTPLAAIAPAAIKATLLYEDRHYYRHPGVNPVALVRAVWSTYVVRTRVVGGSTVTMQLARLRFGIDSATPSGKLVQIVRAVQLERHYSKAQLLEAYLNLAPYGGNVEGLGTAARIYFGKPATELSVPEALALAVIPQNPTARRPDTAAGLAELRTARARLFKRWRETVSTAASTESQMALPLTVATSAALPFQAPLATTRWLTGADRAGGAVRTSLDAALQRLIERQVRRYIERRQAQGIDNAAVLLLDTRSMQVRAEVGSADFHAAAIAGQVNGTQAPRSPGSTLKPFVYALALDAGLIHPMSLLEDAPRRFAAYTPENFDRGFLGPVNARDALIYSRNVPAIDLLNRLGVTRFHDFLARAGVARLREPAHYGLALVLGGNELTMAELVRLYAMLANGGVDRPLTWLAQSTRAPGQRLLSPEASFLILDMLRANPRPDSLPIGTRGGANGIAWKTGTSFAYRDAWSVGIVGPYVLAVWSGHFDGSSNPNLVGRRAAAPLFFAIADALLPRLPAEWRRPPTPPGLNLARVDVCASTGDLPGRHCPGTAPSWFIPGVSPIRVSSVHRALRIDIATGLRSCSHDPATTRTAVFEFWPSNLAALFRKAGVAVRQPPPWMPECSLDVRAASGRPPTIVSPTPGTTLVRRVALAAQQRVPLSATTDADARLLFWFANDRYLGRAGRDEPLLWQPAVGSYRLLAVDDLGRSDTVDVRVAAAAAPVAR